MQLGALGKFSSGTGNTLSMAIESRMDPSEYLERVVPAGEPYQFTMQIAKPYFSCNASMSFIPEPDAQYQLVMSFDGRMCSLTPAKLVKDAQGVVIAEAMRVDRPVFCERPK
jgi:hypothetical protein